MLIADGASIGYRRPGSLLHVTQGAWAAGSGERAAFMRVLVNAAPQESGFGPWLRYPPPILRQLTVVQRLNPGMQTALRAERDALPATVTRPPVLR